MYSVPKEILCIGPVGSGKTTLLRKLQNPNEPLSSTVSTTGNNLLTFEIDKKHVVNINELGGSMVPIWKMYYTNCSALMFVIDSSHLQQISSACISFFEVLNDPFLKDVPVLIVLNKTDIKTTISLSEIKSLLLLDQVSKFANQNITTVECSCYSGEGLNGIRSWLLDIANN